VVTIDWNGKLGVYRVSHLEEKGDGKYSCMFINSSGDIEKQLVNENQLHCD
jgi:hypothetical protein